MVLLRLNKDGSDWDVIDKSDKIESDLYLDGMFKDRLDFAKRLQADNDDVGCCVVGREGSGKSAKAGNIMRYMTNDKFDPKLHMVGAEPIDVVFSKLEQIEEGSAVMFDEGNTYFLSTDTMKREQKDLHKLFSVIRQKRLFLIIVAPSFFRINSYFAKDRTNFLVLTYKVDGKRSYFKYWGEKSKSSLYIQGKKEHDYGAVRFISNGRYTPCYTLETPEYKAYKKKTLQDTFDSFRQASKKPLTEYQIKQEHVKERIKKSPELSSKMIGDVLGITERRVQQIRKGMKEELEFST